MASRGQILFFCANVLGSLASPVVQDASKSIVPVAAAETVLTKSSAGANLFGVEAIQLTERALRSAEAAIDEIDIVSLFGFDNTTNSGTVSNSSRLGGECKTFPGDPSFPRPAVWTTFDRLLGGALIKTTPIGAPCYRNSGVYDAAKCADISARFTTSALQ